MGQMQPAKEVKNYDNNQDQPDDANSSCSPYPVSLIASSAAEYKQQNDNQHDH
jgi:hypothetical protein